MLFLILALVPVLVAPWFAAQLLRNREASEGLDAFVLVSVGGLVLFHILPDAAERGSVAMLLLTALGLGLPWLWERRGASAGNVSTAVRAAALVGLVLHEVLDGAALAQPGNPGSSPLTWAVLLHRLPAALALWLIASSRFGTRKAWLVMGLVAVATCAGFSCAPGLLSATNNLGWAALQALLAGLLLHVLIHHRPAGSAAGFGNGRFHGGALAGSALGILVLFANRHTGARDAGDPLSAATTMVALAFESAPAIVVGFAVAGAIHAWFPERWTSWLNGASSLGQAVRGAALGLPLNICSCGVTPVYQGLVLRGVPAPAAVAFLVAAPELGVASVVLSYQLLGGRVTLARVAAASVLAIGVGLVVGTRIRTGIKKPSGAPLQPDSKPNAIQRLSEGLRFGFGEMVDHTGPWILVGLAVAALLEPLICPEELSLLPGSLEVPLFALIGTPMYVCASGSTPLAAVLMHKGISPGAAIAFLLTGPATNLTTIGVMARLHGKRIALGFSMVMALLATSLGLVINSWLPGDFRMPLHRIAEHHHGWIEWASLAILVVVLGASVLRQGVRGLLAQVFALHRVGERHEHRTCEHAPVTQLHEHHDGCCGGHHHRPIASTRRESVRENRLAPVNLEVDSASLIQILQVQKPEGGA